VRRPPPTGCMVITWSFREPFEKNPTMNVKQCHELVRGVTREVNLNEMPIM
jgi:hypothetical protein